MYVICIDNSFIVNSDLTKYKVYKVLSNVEVTTSYSTIYYKVVNDRGMVFLYDRSRFKPLKENKINNLLYKEIEWT